ncbi:MAG TPA: sulfotransferase [Solirubrobacteraceae bacterium]|nr:sulfotransferase [Solirubrobacteraceae bacterium]
MPEGRMPDFFLVGQPKSGTTALYEMLREHPDIYMPPGKEPWYLAEELLDRTPPRPEGTASTLAEYAALFAGAEPGQRVGEASALYLWSPTAAARIAEVAPDARIVAILREPVGLLRSLHLQFIETYVETETDLRRALELEPARREGREVPRHTYWPRTLLYSEHVAYVTQLRRYEELFGPERMLVLIYDDFRADNERTVRRVLRFLDVDDAVRIAPRYANPSVEVRSGRLHALLHAVSVGHGPLSRAAKTSIKAVTPARLRRGALRAAKDRVVYAPPGGTDEQLARDLRARYHHEVVALGEHLGRDLLSLWGYGDER